MLDGDWPYLWAAYQMGMWQDHFVDEVSHDQFVREVIRWLETVDIDWIMEAEYEGKVRPVGIVLALFRAGGRAIEPHVDWFPWATSRITYECSAHYFRQIRKQYKVFVYSTVEDQPFYDRLQRHRLLTKGCKVADYFQPGEDAMFYYTQGPFA